jgi:DNA-directed RNA polymerase specialized sigma24 family protein
MADFSDVTDEECVRRYYEERDEEAFAAFLGRTGPPVLARLRRFARSRGTPSGSGTSGIEPEDALQYAMARLLEGRFPLGSSTNVQGWLYAAGRNYMIDPWRPHRIAVHIFELWPGPRGNREAVDDVDWLSELITEGLSSTFGEFVPDPEEHLLRELEDADRSRQLDEFREERDKWLAKHPAYLPVVEIIGAGFKRTDIGRVLGMTAIETLFSILGEEGILPTVLSPDRMEEIRVYFRPERVGEILYDVTLKRLKNSIEQKPSSGWHPLINHVNGSQEREAQRRDALLTNCLSMMPTARQRALQLADLGFKGAEIGMLDGRTERAGQLLLNRARKQLEELRRAGLAP